MPTRKRTLLDLGAYDGKASAVFVGQCDRYIMIDNQQYVDYGWLAPLIPNNAELIISDIMDYHEPAEIVVCSNVLCHVPDPHIFLRHLYKLTLEKLVLTTYVDKEGDWNYYYDKIPAHPDHKTALTIWYRPTKEALIQELKDLGFCVDDIRENGEMVTVTCLKK